MPSQYRYPELFVELLPQHTRRYIQVYFLRRIGLAAVYLHFPAMSPQVLFKRAHFSTIPVVF